LTTYLYSGEKTDAATGLQYLGTDGGRCYRSATGTFTTLDSFAGINQDPQSLHKYLYCHGDGINFSDPTGRFEGLAGLTASMAIGAAIGGMLGGIDAALGGDSTFVGIAVGAGMGAKARAERRAVWSSSQTKP